MIRSLVKRSGSHFFGLLFGKLLSTLVFIFLARILVPEAFGKATLYVTLLSLGTLLADFGLNQWYQKNIHFLSKKMHLHSVLSARFITLFVSLFVLGTILILGKSFNLSVSLILLITLVPEALLSVFDGYYFSEKIPLKASGKLILRNILFWVGLLFIWQNPQLHSIVIILLIADFIALAWYFPWKMFKSWQFSWGNGMKTLKSSSQYATLIFTSFAYARGDSLIIEYSIGSTFLGMYSVAYRYLEGLSLLPAAVAQNLFHISAQKNAVSKKELTRITFLMLGVGCAIASVLHLSADVLTIWLLGPLYAQAATLLRIFSVVLLLFFVNSPLSTIVQSSNQFPKFLPWGIANTLLNLLLNIVFIPLYGVTAAAWIMLGTEVTGLLINIWWVRKVYPS